MKLVIRIEPVNAPFRDIARIEQRLAQLRRDLADVRARLLAEGQ